MASVGVRELKARLSEHLRRAEAGEKVTITDRGRSIAILGPAEEVPGPAWVTELVAEGKASWGGRRQPIGQGPGIKAKGRNRLSQAVIEDRR